MCGCYGMQVVLIERNPNIDVILKVDSQFSCSNHCVCKRTNYLIYCGATRGKIENRLNFQVVLKCVAEWLIA